MIVLGIIAWILCAGITCGVMMHVQPDEWDDSELVCMMVCLVSWHLLALGGIVYVILKRLSKIGIFVTGFLDKLFEEKEEQDE